MYACTNNKRFSYSADLTFVILKRIFIVCEHNKLNNLTQRTIEQENINSRPKNENNYPYPDILLYNL